MDLHPAYNAAMPYRVFGFVGIFTAVGGVVFAAATTTTPVATLALVVSACALGLFSFTLFKSASDHAKHVAARIAPYQFDRARFQKKVMALTAEHMAETAAKMGWEFVRKVVDQIAREVAHQIMRNLSPLFARC